MEILLFRTALAPCLVLLVSLAARRIGPRLGGRLLGAPTTSGPFLAVLCLGSGAGAAAHAAHGSAAGQLSVTAFCFSYGRLAPRRRPASALVLSLACVALAGAVETSCGDDVVLPAALALLLVLAGVPAARVRAAETDAETDAPETVSAPESAPGKPNPLSRRAIAARMAVSGTLVLTSVTVARIAGPFAGGMLSALPVLLAVMAPALHRGSGPAAAADLLRGALASAAGTIAFLLVLCVALVPCGAFAAFALALGGLAGTDLLVSRATGRAAAAGRKRSVTDRSTDRRAMRGAPVYFVGIGLVSRHGRLSSGGCAPITARGAAKPAARGGPGRPRRNESADLLPGTRPNPPCPPGRWTR